MGKLFFILILLSIEKKSFLKIRIVIRNFYFLLLRIYNFLNEI
jgi:hypothetical protein